jgi:hypothetical protein
LLVGLSLLELLLLHLSLEQLFTLQPALNLLELDFTQTSFFLVPLFEEFHFELGFARKCINRSDLLLSDLLGSLLVEISQLDLLPKLLDFLVFVDQLFSLALSGLFLELTLLQLPSQLTLRLLKVKADAILLALLLVEVAGSHQIVVTY